MPNLRVIHQNLADTATITASTTSGNYNVSNLKTELKSQFHRSSARTVTYILSWASDQTIDSVVLPCTNLTKTATIRVLVKNVSAAVLEDSGAQIACASTTIDQFTNPNGNLFGYGAVSKTVHWFSQTWTTVRSLEITLTDNNNPLSYLDCSRIVCGTYWSPTYNASKDGLVLTVSDTSTTSRNDAGDLISEQGFVYDQLQLNLDVLTDADRNTLLGITRRRGVSQNILLSVFPDNRTSTELAYLIYGKRSNSSINYIVPGLTSTSLEITGW